MMKYGRPSYFLRGLRLSSTVVTPSASTAASPAPSRPLSRTGSFESLRSTDTTFHSFTSTPRQASVTSFGDHATSSSSGQPHKHTPSWLGMTRADKPGARIATFSNHVSPLSSPKTASRALAIQEEGRSREDSIEQLRDQLQQQDVRSTDQSRAVRSGKTSGTVVSCFWRMQLFSFSDKIPCNSRRTTSITHTMDIQPPATPIQMKPYC